MSPTESGLRMLPQMIGVTAATFGIGRLIARTGRYKPFPIIGSIVSVDRPARRRPDHRHDAVLVAGHADDLHGLRRGVGVHDDVDRQPERRPSSRDLGVVTATVHVLPLARRFVRAGHVRHVAQRDDPHRDPGRASASPPDEAAGLIRSPEEIAALPRDARAGRRRQRGARRQPDLPDLRRRDDVRRRRRHPAAGASAAACAPACPTRWRARRPPAASDARPTRPGSAAGHEHRHRLAAAELEELHPHRHAVAQRRRGRRPAAPC